MSKAFTSIAVAFLFLAAAAIAQTTPGQGGMGSQGTTSQSPSMQSGQNGSMGQDNGTMQGNNGNMNGNTSSTKGEKKLKGCVQQQNGQYMLETRKGKMVTLTGNDVSAQVGHEVTVRGMWAGSNMSATSSSGGEHTFNVTSVNQISDHCSMKNGGSGTMGAGSGSQQ